MNLFRNAVFILIGVNPKLYIGLALIIALFLLL